ncbi:MAG: ABC transporter ATP-binding protein [Ferrimicrobium sp.]|uniref:ABC transporter ATP-binding protein n=1 Tax=Ferrimicrobium sp. TaxID=2926050 RepID=UPI00260D0499|nr:ABC transporter ATP-binding protein [Ferrimicrobium sp.]
MQVLKVDRLTAGYGKIPIVQEVSLEVGVGQVVTIVGPNGAGKSTFLKAVFGLIPRMAGTIHLDGDEITGVPTHRLAHAGVAYVPQNENVFPSMSVEENLELGSFVSSKGFRTRVNDIWEIFPELRPAKGKKAGLLSGGQRNMLGMARALMAEPKVVLLDEPTAGLSPANVEVVWSQIATISELGTSVVVVEQNVDRALDSSDHCYIIVAGRNHDHAAPEILRKLDLAGIFLGASAEQQA